MRVNSTSLSPVSAPGASGVTNREPGDPFGKLKKIMIRKQGDETTGISRRGFVVAIPAIKYGVEQLNYKNVRATDGAA